MKIILVAATSLDGKITRGEEEGTNSWSSPEDKKLFSSLLEKSRLVVMGRKTYEAARANMNLNLDTLRIILTRTPEKFSNKNIPGKLEFTGETPGELVARLEMDGYSELLLVGGGEINTLFLRSELVDELQLTLEPLIFGKGVSLFLEEEFRTRLELVSSKKLNERGTLHLVYKILK